MYDIPRGNTSIPLTFLLVSNADHVTGATGKTPTVTIRKNGETVFVSVNGAVTEIGSGLYAVAPNEDDCDTVGPLALHATATGCDPCDVEFDVVDPDEEGE